MAAPALLRNAFTRSHADPDAELLGRFASRHDPEAFAELVRRHGPVVYRVCRRLLGEFAADDAFQATFLVLATKPASVRKAGSVGSWLVGVAGRVARQTRKARHRRALHEQASGVRQHPGATLPGITEQFKILDEELTRLPDRLRDPVVLCLLQGRTQEQAAADLGGSVRTVRRRLDEAKHLLRTRLERRGVVPAVAAGLAAGVGSVTAAVPAGLPARTAAMVFDFLAGGAATTAPAAVLAHGVATTMLARKLMATMTAVAVGLTALGVGLADDGTKPKPDAPATIPPLNVPVPTPAAAVSVPDPPQLASGYMSPNFVIHAPEEVARQVLQAAEDARKELALAWLGVELPNWKKPCPIHVEIRMRQTGGATTFTYSDDPKKPAVRTMEMKLFGDLQTILRDTLRHEVMHCVLATAFGKPLPRWADEGIAVQVEGTKNRADHDVRCRELLNAGRGISLKALFGLKEYPKDMIVLFAQGYSVCEFLLAHPPGPNREIPGLTDLPVVGVLFQIRPELVSRTRLLTFVEQGMTAGWEKAAKQVYGFDSLDAMQEAWVAWLKQPPKAASTIPPPALGPTGPPATREPPHTTPFVDRGTVPPVPTATAKPLSFVVSYPDPVIARVVRNELEYQWATQTKQWLGHEVVLTPKVHLELHRLEKDSRISAQFWELKVGGKDYWSTPMALSLDLLLTSYFPAELSRMMWIVELEREPPGWVFGAIHTDRTEEVQRDMLDGCCHALVRGEASTLRVLFAAEKHAGLCQGYAVTKFLLSLPLRRAGADDPGPKDSDTPPLRFTRFVKVGTKNGWNIAAKDVYGFADVADMERQWLDWMKRHERFKAAAARPADPTFIPPVKLTADDTVLMRTRIVRLPLAFQPDQRKTVERVTLHVSRNEGKTWEVARETTPDQNHITFTTTEDGVYWFTVSVTHTGGRSEPPDFLVKTPLLKVRIDTTPPNAPAVVSEPHRVGRIFIEGNTVTADRVILAQFGFGPGQLLDYPQLKAAEKKLAQLGVFDSAEPPRVEVIPGDDSGYKDILVRVKEKFPKPDAGSTKKEK